MKNIISKLLYSINKIILVALFILISTFSFIKIMKAADSLPPNLFNESGLIASYQFNGNFDDSTKNNIVTIKNQKDLIVDSKNLKLSDFSAYDPKYRANFITNTKNVTLLIIESLNYYTKAPNYNYATSGINISDSSTGAIDIKHNYFSANYNSCDYNLSGNTYLIQNKPNNPCTTSKLIPVYLDIWIKETIVIDYENKTVDYYRDRQDGSKIDHITLNDINLKKDINTTISFYAWASWVGSTHLVDYLNIYTKQQISDALCTIPKEGDFNISQSCTLNKSSIAPANINIKNGAKLLLNKNIILFFDLKKYKLLIDTNSGVLLDNNASIRQTDEKSNLLIYLEQVNENIEKLGIDPYIKKIKDDLDKIQSQYDEYEYNEGIYNKKLVELQYGKYEDDTKLVELRNNCRSLGDQMNSVKSPSGELIKKQQDVCREYNLYYDSVKLPIKSQYEKYENERRLITPAWQNLVYKNNQLFAVKSYYKKWTESYPQWKNSLISLNNVDLIQISTEIDLISQNLISEYKERINDTVEFWVKSGNQAREIANNVMKDEFNTIAAKFGDFRININNWQEKYKNKAPQSDLFTLANTIETMISELRNGIDNNSLAKDKLQEEFNTLVDTWNKTDWKSKTVFGNSPLLTYTSSSEPTLYQQSTPTLTGASTESNTPTLQYSQNSQYGQGFDDKHINNNNNNIQIDECNSFKEKSIICSIGTIAYYTKESLFGSYCIYNNETKIGIINKNDFENYKKSITNNTCPEAGIPIKNPEKYTFGNEEYVFWELSNGAKFDGPGYSYVLTNEEIISREIYNNNIPSLISVCENFTRKTYAKAIPSKFIHYLNIFRNKLNSEFRIETNNKNISENNDFYYIYPYENEKKVQINNWAGKIKKDSIDKFISEYAKNGICPKAGVPIKDKEEYSAENLKTTFWQWSDGIEISGVDYKNILTNSEINNFSFVEVEKIKNYFTSKCTNSYNLDFKYIPPPNFFLKVLNINIENVNIKDRIKVYNLANALKYKASIEKFISEYVNKNNGNCPSLDEINKISLDSKEFSVILYNSKDELDTLFVQMYFSDQIDIANKNFDQVKIELNNLKNSIEKKGGVIKELYISDHGGNGVQFFDKYEINFLMDKEKLENQTEVMRDDINREKSEILNIIEIYNTVDPQGDIYFIGCNVGNGEEGDKFVKNQGKLANTTYDTNRNIYAYMIFSDLYYGLAYKSDHFIDLAFKDDIYTTMPIKKYNYRDDKIEIINKKLKSIFWGYYGW